MAKNDKKPVVIQVKDVEKSFRVFYDKSQTLKERMLFWKRGKYAEHPVLCGVSIDIRKGETVGLIGRNGSGKSTLLKLMTGIMYPDSGAIDMRGKVSSLLELGAGFHPDFSGRENIYNNASIFGLSRKEIDERYDKIVAFSELEEYIDTPVRTYSSGMYMRLAFSVAINVDAEVLLIDEILAVGDANFQKKCMDMIRKLKRRGITIVLVTHDMNAVERICDKAVWLSDGRIKQAGKTREIIDAYMLDMDKQSAAQNRKEQKRSEEERVERAAQESAQNAKQTTEPETSILEEKSTSGEEKESLAEETAHQASDSIDSTVPLDKDTEQVDEEQISEEESILLEVDEHGEKIRWGTGDVLLTSISYLSLKEEPLDLLTSGDPFILRVNFEVKNAVPTMEFGIGIRNWADELCVATNSFLRREKFTAPKQGMTGYIDFAFSDFYLAKGIYKLDIAVHSQEGLPYDYQRGKESFIVFSPIQDQGIYAPPLKISMHVDEKIAKKT